MNKPYIICHMMMAVDGRIDCGMTVKIKGSNEYYQTLDRLHTSAALSGRHTAELEMAEPGAFKASANARPIDHACFSKKRDTENWQIVVDTHGSLLWPDDAKSSEPLLIILSESAPQEYADYLDSRNISWIAAGRNHIDLARAMDILHDEFHVKRLSIVGGGTINGGFLDGGLLDEVSIVLGPGIDGRKGMTAAFDGLPMDREPVQLKFKNVEVFDDGALWIRYDVLK